jgi:hypothetical protein
LTSRASGSRAVAEPMPRGSARTAGFDDVLGWTTMVRSLRVQSGVVLFGYAR